MKVEVARLIDVMLTKREKEEALMAYCFQKLRLNPSEWDVTEVTLSTDGMFHMNICEIESKPLTPNEQ
jgi:hypothetical protein